MNVDYPHMSIQKQGDAIVIRFDEAMVFDEDNAADIRQAVTELVADQAGINLVLDLGNMTDAESRFFGSLIVMMKRVRAQQGQLRLAAMTENVHEAFCIAALHKTFTICESVEEAIDSF